MEKWLSILIEIGTLGFLGLLYYFYQKRKIIYYSEIEFKQELEKLIIDIHNYLDTKQEDKSYQKLNNFVIEIEKYLDHDLKNLQHYIEVPEELPQSLKEHYVHICNILLKKDS